MKRLAVCFRVALATLLALSCHNTDGPGAKGPVVAIVVGLTPPHLLVGGTAQATALLLDAQGGAIIDRAPTWTSLSPLVASITASGIVTAIQPGTATVRASLDGVTGDATMTVSNPVAGSITFSRDTATLTIPGGSTQLIASVRDASGQLLLNPIITWLSTAPAIATVNSTGLVSGVAVGTAVITATVDGKVAQATIAVTIVSTVNTPLIVSVNPSPLRPGGTFTVVGNNFAPTPAGNAVLVDGVPVTVNASTVNAMSITLPATFPCAPQHAVFVQVTANGLIGGGATSLQVANQRTLAVGQSVIITDPAQVRCNELDITGGRYAVSVYNAYRSTVTPTSNGAVALTVRGAVPAGTVVAAAQRLKVPFTLPAIGSAAFRAMERGQRQREIDAAHARVLERSIEFLRENGAAMRANLQHAEPRRVSSLNAQVATVGSITGVKVPNLSANNFCVTNTPINARTVYNGAHAIILEDTSTIFAGASTLAGQMDSYFQQLGQEFDNVMFALGVANFGDPLVLDAQLGGLGKIVMVFSPRVNSTAEGSILGFVVSCDFSPVTTAPSSNFGEYFYAAVPTSSAGGFFDPNTRDSWLRLIRPSVMHEVKHITAFAQRIAQRNLALEDLSWEEGMARNAEEIYARTFYGTQPKQNSGYAATLGCDAKFAGTTPPCANRPLMMYRHFDALYNYLSQPDGLSMLGRTNPADFTFYASAWSMLRWANDLFSTSESQFFKDWTLSTPTGVANFEARTAQSWEQSLGEWSLAMYVDDLPGFTPANAHLKFLSWNLHDIWAGMCADLGPCTNPNNPSQLYPSANPFNPRLEQFGNFNVSLTSLAGGAFTIFDISGTQTARQLIELKSAAGGDPPSTVRLAIVRIQ